MRLHPQIQRLQSRLSAAPLQKVDHPLLKKYAIELSIKREDQLHPIISGNKWRKLKYNVNLALNLGSDHLISMGGQWSNHLHAMAWLGKELGIKTTGIIRGEQSQESTAMLKEASDWGMQLHYINRSEFRQLRQFKHYDSAPAQQFAGYWIPEGGANSMALEGVAELIDEIDQPYDCLALACGTGTTLAGLAKTLSQQGDQSILGFAALKGAGFLHEEIKELIGDVHNWQLQLDYHFGGFAKTDPSLLEFIDQFQQQTQIPLEPIYTGKMLYGLFDLIRQGKLAGQRIIAIHTGGLQGRRSLA